jgi:hypothetical protein
LKSSHELISYKAINISHQVKGMSVRFKLMKFLLCPGQAGQFVMMYYDQATGMLVPIMSTFAPQSIFEMPPAFPPNATLSGISFP